MAFQSAPGIAQLEVQFNIGGKVCENVFNFKYATTYNQAAMDLLAQTGDGAFGPDMAALITTDNAYTSSIARGLEFSTDVQSTSASNAANGSLTPPSAPNHDSLCLTLRTANTGRSARGRVFAMPTALTEYESANAVLEAYALAVRTAILTLKTDALASGWTMVVLSRRTAGALRAVGVGFPVTDVSVRNFRIDTQRGRMPAPN